MPPPPDASPVTGLHHVTVIAGPAQRHVDFYAGTLGFRLVKQTVNFDAPSVYHLYYADDAARPGSVLTFFPFPDAGPGRGAAGEAVEVAYAVPAGAHAFWMERLAAAGYDDWDAPVERFGQAVLRLRDPDGTPLAFVEEPAVTGGWAEGPVPPEAAAGPFHSVTLALIDPEPTLRLLTEAMGYSEGGQEGDRIRLVNARADRAALVDLVAAPAAPGRSGAGTVHHVAFRVPDDASEGDLRETLLSRGFRPTPVIDRQYFHSVYFREPGGVLFEIATDLPGFATDEPADALGRALMLPPQYEPQRARIAAGLPPLEIPTGSDER